MMASISTEIKFVNNVITERKYNETFSFNHLFWYNRFKKLEKVHVALIKFYYLSRRVKTNDTRETNMAAEL